MKSQTWKLYGEWDSNPAPVTRLNDLANRPLQPLSNSPKWARVNSGTTDHAYQACSKSPERAQVKNLVMNLCSKW